MVLPISIYLILMATVFKIQPDIKIDRDFDDVIVEKYEKKYLVYSDIDTSFIGGSVIYHDDMIKVIVSDKDIIKLNKGFYQINKEGVLVDVAEIKTESTKGIYITFSVAIGIIATVIGLRVIMGKMEWHKKYKRTAVLLSLVIGTAVLFFMDMVVGHFLYVFYVLTGSWVAYLIEYAFWKGVVDERTRKELQDKIKRGI